MPAISARPAAVVTDMRVPPQSNLFLNLLDIIAEIYAVLISVTKFRRRFAAIFRMLSTGMPQNNFRALFSCVLLYGIIVVS